MKLPRTRDEVLDLAARHAPTKAISRVITEEGASVLGGFTAIKGFPGWIVEARGRYIGFGVDEQNRRLVVEYLAAVPWEDYMGTVNKVKRLLVDGDDPVQASYNRMKACQARQRSLRFEKRKPT